MLARGRAVRAVRLLGIGLVGLVACRAPTPSSRASTDEAGASAEAPLPSASVVASAAPSHAASHPVGDGRDGPAARAVACLSAHYVGRVSAGASGEGGAALVLPDGARIPYDDGRVKTPDARIAGPDIEDLFSVAYPANGAPIAPVTDPAVDPGRARIEALLRATYGESAAAVDRALVRVNFRGHVVRFHPRAASALQAVDRRLGVIVGADPSLARFFVELGGTFNPRKIAGTDRASAHAFGIAIDIDPSLSDYWRNAGARIAWRNRVAQAIVDAFEAEGFVWGGRWYHYDTMHFEFRPELFDPRCRTAR